jgi:hypothetical protein
VFSDQAPTYITLQIPKGKAVAMHEGFIAPPPGISLAPWATGGLQQVDKFLDGETCITNDGPERPFRNLFVVGDGQSTVRLLRMSQYHVASGLVVDLISNLRQCFDNLDP